MKDVRTGAAKKSNAGKSGPLPAATSANHRERILKAAMVLLARGGRDALTTRAVAAAARVQPPVLYRLFRDKAGLLNAVADFGFGVYLEKKSPAARTDDPVEALRAGWKLHLDFGLSHPELYLLMYADPHPGSEPEFESQAGARAHRMLLDHMHAVAAKGRLRVGEERAAHLYHAAACGMVMTLLGMTGEERDLSLADAACEAALAAILTDRPAGRTPDLPVAATTLRALVTGGAAANVLTKGERALLVEWLDRLAGADGLSPASRSDPRG